MNKDIIGGFWWGVMICFSGYAFGLYLIDDNNSERKEKTLIELQIEHKKLEIELLKRGDNDS